MASLKAHRDYLDAEWQAAQAAPLSARKAMLVAMLIDAYVDRLFAAKAEPDDILRYRETMAAASPALELVIALCAGRNGVHMVTEAVSIPIAEYGTLSVEDFMVSLYNDRTVQRLRLARAEGESLEMLQVLAEAMAALPAA